MICRSGLPLRQVANEVVSLPAVVSAIPGKTGSEGVKSERLVGGRRAVPEHAGATLRSSSQRKPLVPPLLAARARVGKDERDRERDGSC